MNPDDVRERDQIRKMLRRKPIDPNAPPKPTTPELMQRLTGGIVDEYTVGSEARTDQTRALFNETKEQQ